MAPKVAVITVEALLKSEKAQELVNELSFEQGIKLLEELVQQMESGQLPLETALNAYERGVALTHKLRGLLTGAEEKLKVLSKSSDKVSEV